jgi:hypothetical protein
MENWNAFQALQIFIGNNLFAEFSGMCDSLVENTKLQLQCQGGEGGW